MAALIALTPPLRSAGLIRYKPRPAALVALNIEQLALQTCSGRTTARHRQRRQIHSRRNVSYAVSPALPISLPATEASIPANNASTRPPPLSILPLPHLLRSYFISTISSSPSLLRGSVALLKLLARSQSPLLSPDRNPLLHFLLKKTVYAQFCAGETAEEVKATISRLKGMGYGGVMLCYAREVVMGQEAQQGLDDSLEDSDVDALQVAQWAEGTTKTVEMAEKGDFVAVKFTGAGQQTLKALMKGKKPSPKLEAAIKNICEVAKSRGVRLAFDAEQDAVQSGIDAWTLGFMRLYNTHGRAMVYGTYQTYRKDAPLVLAKHMDIAQREGFVLGVKLVRGAYLGSDPRHLFWDSAEETHRCYNSLASSLMDCKYNQDLRPAPKASGFPLVNLFLAGHNAESVEKAQKFRNSQVLASRRRIDLAYGQLLGMAENISCSLVAAGRSARDEGRENLIDVPQAYQYVVWGSVAECSQYLVRRAEENKDAVARTMDAKKALGRDLMRRMGLSWLIGLKA